MRENNSFLTVCFQQKHVKIYIIFSGTPGKNTLVFCPSNCVTIISVGIDRHK